MRFRILLFLISFLSGTFAFSQSEKVQETAVADTASADRYMESDSLVKTDYFTDNILYPKKIAPNFKNKYKGNEFNYEVLKPKESFLDVIKRKISRLLSKIFKDIDPNKAANYTTNILRFFGIAIIGLLLYILIRYLLSKDGNLFFGKRNRKIAITTQNIEENIHEINFPERILQLEKQEDYRSAIRYHFLYSLKKMTDKNIINWNPEKTNRDYLKELKNNSLKEDFRRIIYIYDYIWYGEFETSEKDYQHSKSYFSKF